MNHAQQMASKRRKPKSVKIGEVTFTSLTRAARFHGVAPSTVSKALKANGTVRGLAVSRG